MSFKLNSIRNIYFYVVSLIALMMIVFSVADLINLGLTTWVFKTADRVDDWAPPAPYILSEQKLGETAERCAEKCDLTDEEKQQIKQWLADYKNWQENQQNVFKIARKQKNAVRDISMLVVAVPLFIWHWKTINKEIKKEKEDKEIS